MGKRFILDFESAVPIFQQIVQEMERRILVGELKEGDYLTSVREFAVANTVNPNTVAKAYQQLQSLGLVEAVRGKGLAVKRLKEKAASERREDIIGEKARELLDLGDSLNLSLDDLIEILKTHRRKR